MVNHTMASEKHKECADFIKGVHSSLRQLSQTIGYDEAWKLHCSEDKNLSLYAEAMSQLGSKHWEENAADPSKLASSRISWAINYCRKYFFDGEKEHRRRKEFITIDMMDLSRDVKQFCSITREKLKVLDVGSCYNPFSSCEYMEVLPVDLAPAISEVYQCDFLNVTLAGQDYKADGKIKMLQRESYDVVIFCLLLEYLPASEQRKICCQKALDLLLYEGILIIITPDSKHVGANAKLFKNWRYTLALMGFSRIKYEKLPFLHCMVFRKALHPDTTKHWAETHKEPYMTSNINIPQDVPEVNDTLSNEITIVE